MSTPVTLGATTPLRAVRAFGLLVRRGDLGGVLMFSVLCFIAVLNAALMWLEDRLVPGLATLPLDRVIFILGHHRSGTTNLHKALSGHPSLRCGTLYDGLFPSLFLKRLFRTRAAQWVRRALDRTAAARYDSANHAVGLDEELEEHLWLLHRLRCEAFLLIFPSLVRETSELMADFVAVTEADLVFLMRCLRRMVYDQRHADVTYLARPLLLTMHVQALLRHFPNAQVVLCIREPRAAIRSHGAMTQAQLRSAPDDPRLLAWTEGFYRAASIRQYRAMLELLRNFRDKGQVLAVDFQDLQRDPGLALREIIAKLGLPAAELSPVRSEQHFGVAPLLIAPERIEADLGAVYRQLQAFLPRVTPTHD